jgi:hypothetical protein
MDVRELEPRTVMWAVAEVFWDDASGMPNRVSATMEDTSRSGACVRTRRSFDVGSHVTIKWHREQFSAIAKNCRSDGRDFLVGLRRESDRNCVPPGLPPDLESKPTKPFEPPVDAPKSLPAPANARNANVAVGPKIASPVKLPKPVDMPAASAAQPTKDIRDRASALAQIAVPHRSALAAARFPGSSTSPQNQGSSSRHERKAMASKSVFPKFWRRQQGEDAPKHATLKEAPVNSSSSKAPGAETLSVPGSDLLSYDDIYHAAGIMSPRSGYGIHKVVEMLNSQRIRELSTDIKRASVLMALDAAGTSVDDVLQDATRRQQALDTYEAAQRKQVEEFEAQKSKENAEIEAEMERIRTHYGQRIQSNRDQIAREKETLRNWQMAMQHESQRITEVIELCRKQPAAAAVGAPQSAPTPAPGAAKASSATHA